MSKRKNEGPQPEGEKLEIIPLGAGNEVGRSCCYMTYKGKIVMFDCGIHPAYSGLAALPFFDEIDPSEIDVLLITHFHLDHVGSLPYFLEKTTFKGRVFMTHATKAIYKLMVSDSIRISKFSSDEMLFDESDLQRTMDKIEVIDYHQTMEVNGIRFWCYTAGHVLGAAMFMVDIAGVRVLYTGDYSREEDRHLKAAEMPPFSPDVCIIESTYGVQTHQPRNVRERRFTEVVSTTVQQGGRVLIPAFALGRAQELLLILEDYWEAHPELQHIPIYYASPLAKRCMTVYQTYINSMNDRIQKQYQVSNPFNFKHITALSSIDQFEDTGPVVVMASPGMLQSGLSRQLFDLWCQDKRNSCIIPGYSVEGTLAKAILSEPKEVTLQSGLTVPLNMKVHYISFSAHADYTQTSEFLKELKPPNIVLVHGEAGEMHRLKSKLVTLFEEAEGTRVMTPKNIQPVELMFNSKKTAKAVGKLAEGTPKEGDSVGGVLVKKGFTYQLMAPEDLRTYTQLSIWNVVQRQSVPFRAPFLALKHKLEQMFEGVEMPSKVDVPTLVVHENLTITQESPEHLVLKWESDPVSDMVADAALALILQLDSRPADVLALPMKAGHGPPSDSEEIVALGALLRSIFGDVEVDKEQKELTVNINGLKAAVKHGSQEILCEDEKLKERIRDALKRIEIAMHPLEF